MLFSVGTGYALHALSSLPEDGTFLLAKEVAERTGLPVPYLAKVLQSLAHAGILDSVRGPHGGFRLARPAAEITLADVVAALNDLESEACVMGFTQCLSRVKPCPLHQAWCEAKAGLDETMAHLTVRDLRGVDLTHLKVVPRVRCMEA